MTAMTDTRTLRSTGLSLLRDAEDRPLVAHVLMPGEPVSKARARFSQRGSTYTPQTTRAAEEKFAWCFRKAAPGWRTDGESAFGVLAIFYPGTRQRRDVDNMLKLVLDASNKLVWADDFQVTEVSGRIVFDDPTPRTEVAIYLVPKQEPPTRACEQCGSAIRLYGSTSKTRFCSRACNSAFRRDARSINCPGCRRQFIPRTPGARKYCSDECKTRAHLNVVACAQCGTKVERWKSQTQKRNFCSADCSKLFWSKNQRRAKGSCSACGGPTSRATVLRCQGCVSAGRAAPETSRERRLLATRDTQSSLTITDLSAVARG